MNRFLLEYRKDYLRREKYIKITRTFPLSLKNPMVYLFQRSILFPWSLKANNDDKESSLCSVVFPPKLSSSGNIKTYDMERYTNVEDLVV